MSRVRLICAALMAVGFSSAAGADEVHAYAELVCDPARNVAVARFAEAYNEDQPAYARLPRAVDGGLSAKVPTKQQTCRLKNGWEVRVRSGTSQAFAYGPGGANPPSFFSLWVDRRKVVSKQIWTEWSYNEERTPIAAVVVKSGSLTVCEGEERVRCKREPLALGRYKLDPLEYPPAGERRPEAGTISILTGAQDNLCRSLIKREQSDGIALERLNLTEHQGEGQWPFIFNTKAIFGVGDEHDSSYTTFPPHGAEDIDGDKIADTVVGRFDDNRYFDGSFWIAAPKTISVIDVLRGIYPGESTDEEVAIGLAEGLGWSVYSGGRPGLYPDVSPRYVSMEMLRHAGETLFLARPTNERHQPTAILIRPRPKDRFDTVCVFQEVLPNF